RGTAVTPEQLRRQLAHTGDATATIVLTRVGGSQQVLVVEPLSAPPAGAGQDGPR
ncbi:MAG: THUMP-like domain-containing protein, partial [Cellulosimicrobium funkei]